MQDGVATSYSTNNLNEYTLVGGTAQTYETNGNLTIIAGCTASYDAQNRLIGATPNVNGASRVLTVAYDARNRPVVRTVNGAVTYLFYDRWNLVAEFDGSSKAQTTSYVHGAVVDELLVRTDNNGVWYYHHDALGSTVALTNTSGQLIEQYSYDVFGNPTIKSAAGTIVADSLYGNRFLFTGREWLPSVEIYDYRNRLYSQKIGKFIQLDPIRFYGADINMYSYAGCNPVNWFDPSGLVHIGPPDPAGNHVVCQDGVSTIQIGTGNASSSKDVINCIKKHEQQHIDDNPPDLCKGKPNGSIAYFDNDAERNYYEKRACAVELDCLKKCPQTNETRRRYNAEKVYCDTFK